MINLLVGPPGGGKSYEAVAYHALPALAAGRKVITNLPFDLSYIKDNHPEYLPLLDIRIETKKARPTVDWNKAESTFKKFGIVQKQNYFINAPFAHAEDYGDPWRHPETGSGPLYIIDECHIPLPTKGTSMEVEHWYSLHRHESADVLLMTQSFGKINAAIRDLVQICYRVKKGTAFGVAGSYVRKVQDGIRGEVVNVGVRKYDKKYFPYYKSHTKGGGAELAAQDIIPIWKNWSFMGAGICLISFVILLMSGYVKNPMNAASYSKKAADVKVASAPLNLAQSSNLPQSPEPQSQQLALPPVVVSDDPFNAYGLHLVGHIKSKLRDSWIIGLSFNGNLFNTITSLDLVLLGYVFTPVSDCAAWADFKGKKRFLTCDTPRVSVDTAIKR